VQDAAPTSLPLVRTGKLTVVRTLDDLWSAASEGAEHVELREHLNVAYSSISLAGTPVLYRFESLGSLRVCTRPCSTVL
jgi:hypothetical protein